MEEVYVGLGSNVGEKSDFLRQAVQQIQNLPRTERLCCSSMWQTEPWGTEGQEVYLNAVVRFFTDQTPDELLTSLQNIEQALGRVRPYHWAPRTIDLDLLLYGDKVLHTPRLTVPHPWMKQRLFVLVPLQELNPTLRFPDGEALEEILKPLIQKETLQGIQKTQEKW